MALLINIPLGLKLSENDIESLFQTTLDANSSDAVKAALVSESAHAFLSKHEWISPAKDILSQSEKRGIRWVHIGDPDYPQAWRGLSRKPYIFSYQGEPVWRNIPLLSIVGSRTPSRETLLWLQRELAEFLRIREVGIVSGGARGIDQWVHRQALDSRRPTVCILPTGLLNPYPFEREELWAKIRAKGGCMVSTYSLKQALHKGLFHERNRWIAGLAPLCLIAEANRRSGSALTAQLAREESREICTLPVAPTATQGLGNLDLIADGATMLRDCQDLLVAWDRSSPTALHRAQGEEQKDDVH